MSQRSVRLAVFAIAAVMLLSAVPLCASESSADSGGDVLIDTGDGATYWSDAGSGTYLQILTSAASSAGFELAYDGAISVDGLESRTTGDVTAEWRVYVWEDGAWSDVTSSIDLGSDYQDECLALGFYPEGTAPVETPDDPSSWTMIRGDSSNSGSQTVDLTYGDGEVSWSYTYGTSVYVDGAILVAGGMAFVVSGGGYTSKMDDPAVHCYDLETGEELWSYSYDKSAGYETATGAIVGGYIYIPATNGSIYKIPLTGPGDDDEYVEYVTISKSNTVDVGRTYSITGTKYATGASSLVYDSGMLYFGSSNGHVYCMDLDLNVVWSTEIGGCVYYNSPTIYGDYVLVGALDGVLYMFDRYTGEILDSETVYTTTSSSGSVYGLACVPVVVDGVAMLSFSDGQGMNSLTGGVAGYAVGDGTLEEVFKEEVGLCGTYVTPVSRSSFSGVYYSTAGCVYRVSTSGDIELIASDLATIKSPITLVNGNVLYLAEYDTGGNIYAMSLSGEILGQMAQPDDVAQYVMSPVVAVDGMLLMGTDGGAFAYAGSLLSEAVEDDEDDVVTGGTDSDGDDGSGTDSGTSSGDDDTDSDTSSGDDDTDSGTGTDTSSGDDDADSGTSDDTEDVEDVADEDTEWSPGWLIAGLLIVLVMLCLLVYVYRRRTAYREPPSDGAHLSKVRRSKRRLAIVLALGSVLAIVIFIATLMVGPSGTYGFTEALSLLGSSIGKVIDGESLVYDEIIVFDSRCSRAVAAFAVGIGLSVAGCMYQAIIRNPMVDPYIMGVSSGAGVAAVAVIAFDFTFFGLLEDTTFATPIVAMIGGLAAFAFTMLLAEKAGGSSVNYVLAGVIVGLVFSAFQTLLLSLSGDKLNDAISWLFGSFANVSWTEAVLIVIPVIAMSIVPLIWAKEFNLVLLGEDQAKQMGLDVRRFNRGMLILASILASVCVAFVGIIGFVGMVVPHLCRMVLGSDHRLVLPASMVVGGALMMAADLFAKMVAVPLELPVGAITTIIGAPVFAYLLIKKGRMYDG